ncbi:hypothetical protein [Rhodanobacter hydrolyticus]|uniref:Uncharacterized protein n=1 Tax=Rhodanobacter hydrolyticus TaxID=2250595 RepID=A0ABW8J3X1_9GAMM
MVAQVGFPQGLEYEDGTPVAYVAAIQNFGAPAVGIPKRPFIEPAISDHKQDWVRLMGHGARKVGEGSLSAFDVLDGVGRMAVGDIQEEIASITSPELSPITVLLRKWMKEGRTITGKTVGEAAQAIEDGVDPGTDDKPLNATGFLIASVRNAVNKADAEFEAE